MSKQKIQIWHTDGDQEVYVNPPGGQPPRTEPHYAAGPLQLLVVAGVVAFLVLIACGVATALTAGAIW